MDNHNIHLMNYDKRMLNETVYFKYHISYSNYNIIYNINRTDQNSSKKQPVIT